MKVSVNGAKTNTATLNDLTNRVVTLETSDGAQNTNLGTLYTKATTLAAKQGLIQKQMTALTSRVTKVENK